MDGDQGGNPLAFLELGADRMTRALGSDHDYVHIGRGLDLPEMDVEAVGEGKILACTQIGFHAVAVDLCLLLIGEQQHDDLCHGTGLLDGRDLKSGFLCNRPTLGTLVQTDDHINPALMQVQCVCMPLAAVSDDGNLLSIKLLEICL
ncbi:hypothetical protein SDC9_112020 [bioreactor metagenome]|uniref:Uncharacterized protein n=1 Tax=bioreactor metagenome TaxID=1076179 RepID=A0A645BJ61_9ZZZZ